MQSLQKVEKETKHIAEFPGGTVGLSVLHIESGQKLTLNASDSFPMASTYKVAIAVQVLNLINKEKVALNQMIELNQEDLSPGSGMIGSHLYQPGVQLSVYNLLEMMLTISDNTASDLLLTLAGGPVAVTECLRTSGIEGIRIDRSTKDILSDVLGISGLMAEGEWSLQRFKEHQEVLTPESKRAAGEVFLADQRDTSTPDAMVSLLERVYSNAQLKEVHTELLLNIMGRCRTGQSRLKGMLPFGTDVAHKTGSLSGLAINDVGIITLPDEAGHLAIAAFIRSPEKSDEECEQVIAHIARSVYDFFLFAQEAMSFRG